MSLGDQLRRSPTALSLLSAPLALRRVWLRRRARPAAELLGRVERLIVDDVRVRVDEFEGEFMLSPRSHLFHRLLQEGEYEPKLVALFRKHLRADADVIDVGANVGFFSVLAAKSLTTGRVLAVEPTGGAHRRLVLNLAINGVAERVLVEQCFAGAAPAETSMSVVPGREEYSSRGSLLHPAVAGEAALLETVPVRTLESLVQAHQLRPAVIKIDVEGAEGEVLAGAEGVLKQYRPILIAEFSRPLLEANGSSPEAILRRLADCGYTVTDPLVRGRPPGSVPFGDIIAIPHD